MTKTKEGDLGIVIAENEDVELWMSFVKSSKNQLTELLKQIKLTEAMIETGEKRLAEEKAKANK